MTDENPYRYEGTAESLHDRPKPPPRPPGNILVAGVFAAIAAAFSGTIAASVIDSEAIGAALLLTLFVLLPIVVFCVKYAFTSNQKSSLIASGIAAAPLQFFFLLMILQGGGGGEAGIAREIGIMATINYGVQLTAALLVLLAVTEW